MAPTDQNPVGEPGESSGGTQVNLAMMAVGSIGAVFALGGLLGWGPRAGIGVVVGAVIAVANLWVFKRVGAAFLSNSGSSRAIWGLVGALKFVFLLAGVGLLLYHRVVDALPLIVGYGALPLGITLSAFLAAKFDDGA